MKIPFGFITPVLIWLSIALTLVYQWHMPVVIFMRAEHWRVTERQVSARVYGYKWRACELIKGGSVGFLRRDHVWQEVPFRYEDDITPDNSKPTGLHSFDLWVWLEVANDGQHPDAALVTVRHRCPFGEVQTEIGPFEIEYPPKAPAVRDGG